MKVIFIFQIIISLLLTVLVLLQAGKGFLSKWGGYGTRRGVEKALFYLTAFLAFAFLSVSFLGAWWH